MSPLVEVRRATTRRHPDHTAVVEGDATLTWSALAEAVDGLAGALWAAGVRPGDRVGLLARRSTEAVVGVHAVLRCGAVWVPLDPSHPPRRLGQVLADAAPSAVLVQAGAARRHAGTLSRSAAVAVALSARAPTPPASTRAAEAPACILYTSGSTGRPKGVVLSAEAVLAFVTWAADTLQLSPADRVAHLSPLSFDLCTLELFAPALRGGATVVVPPGAPLFPAELCQRVAACTVVYTVPSVWRRLATTDLARLADGPLRHIVYAGEAYPPLDLAHLMAQLPGRPVHNFFGPTETNVCCAHRLDRPPVGPVPIGRAASGAHLTIEPDHPHTPAVGELWVRGPSVMSGYWATPTLDRSAFAVRADGTRWLRTGDRVRRDASGTLWALGRRDTMLKHQGFRLQPEEVEAVLGEVPGVASVRVHVEAGQLIAELEGPPGPDRPSSAHLTRHLRRCLPPFMVPSGFVWVAALPRTARGKLDRHTPALPEEPSTAARPPSPSRD